MIEGLCWRPLTILLISWSRGGPTGNGALLPWPFTHLPSLSNFCCTKNALPTWAPLLQDHQKCFQVNFQPLLQKLCYYCSKKKQPTPLLCFTAYYCIVGVCVPPPNSCLCAVLVADLHVGGALAVIYSLHGHGEPNPPTDPTDWSQRLIPLLCVCRWSCSLAASPASCRNSVSCPSSTSATRTWSGCCSPPSSQPATTTSTTRWSCSRRWAACCWRPSSR